MCNLSWKTFNMTITFAFDGECKYKNNNSVIYSLGGKSISEVTIK